MADATAPPADALARIRAFTARDDVPDATKQAAVEAFARDYPPPGSQAPAAAAQGAPGGAGELGPSAVSTAPTRTVSRVGGGGMVHGAPVEVVPPGETDTLKATPQSEVATEATIRAAGVAGSALAFVPGLEGTGLLMTGVRAALSVLGGVGLREAATRMLRPSGQVLPGERAEEAISDALPVLAHGIFAPLVLNPAELDTFGKEAAELVGPKPVLEPKPPKPVLERPLKPGAEPRPPKAAAVPEVAPGVKAGDISPLPVTPAESSLGPKWTRVTTEALDATEKTNANLYDASIAKANKLGLSEPVPKHIIDAARDSLERLDESGLDDQSKSAARKWLESIRDVAGEGGAPEEGVPIVTRKGKEPVESVSYADLDAWRRSGQKIAPGFDRVGTSQTFEQGSVGRVVGLIKDDMKKLATGTEVEGLHRIAEDHFINEVRPMQKLTRAVFRGEAEPNQLVDAMTSKAHQHKFVRWMGVLDNDAPGLAQRVRTTKLQNMIERSTEEGRFNSETFLGELDNMTDGTRKALLGAGGDRNDLAEFVTNVQHAQNTAKLAQVDAQAALDETHARALAGYNQATSDYRNAAARNQFAREQYARETTATQTRNAAAQAQYAQNIDAAQGELNRIKKKVSKQAILLGLPAEGAGLYQAAHALMNGEAAPFFYWMGGGLSAGKTVSWIASRPAAVKTTNLIFRALAAGASPQVVSRLGAQLVSHLLVGYGHAVFSSPAESHANLPPPAAQSDAGSFARFSSAVPAQMPVAP